LLSCQFAFENMAYGGLPPGRSRGSEGDRQRIAAQDHEGDQPSNRALEACLREPIKPSSPDKMALCPIVLLSAAHIRMPRDRRADKPGAANNRLKYMSSMLAWAVDRNLIRSNPARDVKPLHYSTDGFHAWTPDEVKQFEAPHPIGTKPRLALALMLFATNAIRLACLSAARMVYARLALRLPRSAVRPTVN
jgi:hypothetical protein